MIRYLICILLFCFTSTVAHALTGNELKEFSIATKNGFREGIFFGYFEGVLDARYREVCVPTGVTKQQCADVVKKYLIDNPAILHKPADDLVLRAINNAWPCNK